MRFLVLLVVLAGCAAPTAIDSVAQSTAAGLHLVAANSSRNVWASPAPAAPRQPAVASGRRVVWVSTTACVLPLAAGESAERVPTGDRKRCVGIVERVLVDGDVPDERVQRVEELTIEDVAVKLEALLRGDDAENSD